MNYILVNRDLNIELADNTENKRFWKQICKFGEYVNPNALRLQFSNNLEYDIIKFIAKTTPELLQFPDNLEYNIIILGRTDGVIRYSSLTIQNMI